MYDVFLRKFDNYSGKLEPFFNGFFKLNSGRLSGCKKILLKPNLLQAAPPEKGITTHPEFVKQLVRSLRKYTNASLILADSPGANFINYQKVLEITGMQEICYNENIEIQKIESYPPVSDGNLVYSGIVDDVDLIINIAKLKTHSLTGLTMCVKNFFGLVPGTQKVDYHRKFQSGDELGKAICHLAANFFPKSLNFLDGITALEGEGPSRGRPVKLGIAAASDNAAALDVTVTNLLNVNTDFCTTNIPALEYFDINKLNINSNMPEEIYNIKKPLTTRKVKIPSFVKKYVADKIYIKPEINQKKCTTCLLCLKSCYADAISFNNKYVKINKEICKECFCCYEVCEYKAVMLKRSFLHKVFVR